MWGWGLYGNDDPKGWELLPSEKSKLEFGGRIQGPLLGGQMGISSNRRTVDASSLQSSGTNSNGESFPETRLGLDGRWDVGVGLWFESVMIWSDDNQNDVGNQRLLTMGGDYTIGWGNGLHVLAEQFFGDSTSGISSGSSASITAAALDYPLGLSDTISLFAYYTWDEGQWSRLFRWGHQFDRFTLHVIGFWNDDQKSAGITTGGDERYSGTGIQLLAVWKH